jgi:hypothetical protein
MVDCVRDARWNGLDSRDALQAALAPSESVRWSGRGSSAVTAGGRIYNAAFGTFFFVLGLWLLATAWKRREFDSRLWLPCFGAAFTILGPLIAYSPFAADRRAGRAWFAVTDARALIALDRGGVEILSYKADEIGPIRTEAASGGRGHVWFAKSYDPVFARGPYFSRGRTSQRPVTPFDAGFAGVEDPAGAERALRALKASAAGRAAA